MTISVNASNVSPAARALSHGATMRGDRWIFVLMASLFLVTTLTGFIPDSLAKIAAVHAGARPPFPPILHIHAVLMACWLLLLFIQTSLVATGRGAAHRSLGMASFALLLAIVVVGLIVVPTMYRPAWSAAQLAPPDTKDALQSGLKILSDIALLQIRIGLFFPLFVALALLKRRSDPTLHTRWIILATAITLPAATDRIGWLPTTWPSSTIKRSMGAAFDRADVCVGLVPHAPDPPGLHHLGCCVPAFDRRRELTLELASLAGDGPSSHGRGTMICQDRTRVDPEAAVQVARPARQQYLR